MNPLVRQFLDYCRDGNLADLKKSWSEKTFPPEVADPNGQNGLMLAALNGRREVVLYLLEEGVDINLKDKEGRNALHIVCNSENPNKQMILLLMMNKIEHNDVDKQNKLPGGDRSDLLQFMNEVEGRFNEDLRREPLFWCTRPRTDQGTYENI